MAQNSFLKGVIQTLNTFFIVIKYTVLTLVVLSISIVAILIPSYKDLLAAGQNALAAKDNLELAVSALQDKDIEKAKPAVEAANLGFLASLEDLEQVSSRKVISVLPFLKSQVDDLSYVLKTGEVVSRSLYNVLPLASDLNDIMYNGGVFEPLNDAKKAALIKLAYESEPELIGLKANLELALLDLNKINKFGVFYPFYNELNFAREEFESVLNIVEKASYLSKVVPVLAGYPKDANFLFVMHNNDELRPSGGFIGVYGLMQTSEGKVNYLTTYDSYHLDMPASISGNWNLTPPEPITKYMNVKYWYLRDSNWSPDWPTSARNIQSIYLGEKAAIGEEAQPFTGIIGLSPDFVAELINLVGPIVIRGEVYDQNNFQELLQYNVEVSYLEQGISTWDRKDVVNEIVYELKNRLFALSPDRLTDLVNVVSKNVANKNIQLYFNDPNIEDLALRLNAGGEMKQTAGDYLMVVDANLGAFKSDAVVVKSINYEVDLQKDKSESKLRLGYRHEGGFDWRTTRYRSYTRVYVPFGSKLESVKSFGMAKLDQDSVISYNDTELNKTVFAFFFSLEPGTAGGVDIAYQLDPAMSKYFEDNKYALFAQKQSGRRTESVEFRLKSEGSLKYEDRYSLDRDFLVSF